MRKDLIKDCTQAFGVQKFWDVQCSAASPGDDEGRVCAWGGKRRKLRMLVDCSRCRGASAAVAVHRADLEAPV